MTYKDKQFSTESQSQNPTSTTTSSVDELMKPFDSPVLKEQEKRIEQDLQA